MKLKYRKYELVSNQGIYNILWCGTKANFADIPYGKPNISQVPIYLEYTSLGSTCGYHIFSEL